MNSVRLLPPALVLLLLCGCTGIRTSSKEEIRQERLAACTVIGSMFETIAFKDWPEKYHTTVATVVEAHLESLRSTQTQELECTAKDYQSMIKPTADLKKLAQTLEPWKDPADLKKLSEMDIGTVLLEYLRIYECSLKERRNEVSTAIRKEFASSAGTDAIGMIRKLFDDTGDENRRIIDHEIALARPALDRTLLIVGGQDRLRPLSLDIECLKRVSLDIRNITGLISQASMCMPRVQDARSGLRDLPDLPPMPTPTPTPAS